MLLMESESSERKNSTRFLKRRAASSARGATFVEKQRSEAPALETEAAALAKPSICMFKDKPSPSSIKCCSCGESGVFLHRISGYCGTFHGSYRCSSCVLSSNSHMYCHLCLLFIKNGFPSPYPSSSSSQESGLLLCDECSAKGRPSGNRHDPQMSKMVISGKAKKAHNFSSSNHKAKIAGINREVVTAARIVAAIAEKEAFRLRKKAMDKSKAAAHAALRAQRVLDTAYDLKREEDEKAGRSHADDEE